MSAVERIRVFADLRVLVARYAVELPGMEADVCMSEQRALSSGWLGKIMLRTKGRVYVSRDHMVLSMQRARPRWLKGLEPSVVEKLGLTWADIADMPLDNVRALSSSCPEIFAKWLFPIERGRLRGFHLGRLTTRTFEWCLRQFATPPRIEQFIERACCEADTPLHVLVSALKWCAGRLVVDDSIYRELIEWGIREDNEEFALWVAEKAGQAGAIVRPLHARLFHWMGCACNMSVLHRTRLLRWGLREFGLRQDFVTGLSVGVAPRVRRWAEKIQRTGKLTSERGYNVLRI